MTQAFSSFVSSVPNRVGPAAKAPESRKSIRQVLGHPGPPGHGKYRRGDRVCDNRGITWRCTKGGQPGCWEQE